MSDSEWRLKCLAIVTIIKLPASPASHTTAFQRGGAHWLSRFSIGFFLLQQNERGSMGRRYDFKAKSIRLWSREFEATVYLQRLRATSEILDLLRPSLTRLLGFYSDCDISKWFRNFLFCVIVSFAKTFFRADFLGGWLTSLTKFCHRFKCLHHLPSAKMHACFVTLSKAETENFCYGCCPVVRHTLVKSGHIWVLSILSLRYFKSARFSVRSSLLRYSFKYTCTLYSPIVEAMLKITLTWTSFVKLLLAFPSSSQYRPY